MSDQTTLDDYCSELAEHAQDLGQHRALTAVTDDDWNARAWDAITGFVDAGIPFDSDDLRALVGPPPSKGAPGAIIKKANAAGLITAVGFARSKSVTRHAGLQLVWGPA